MLRPRLFTLLRLISGLVLAGDLNIKRDMTVAATKGHKDGQHIWSSILELEKKSGNQGVSRRKWCASYTTPARRCAAPGTSRSRTTKRPSIMTSIKVNNEIYFASSMKGNYYFIYEYKTKDKGGKVGDEAIRKSVPHEIAQTLGNAKSAESGQRRNNEQPNNDASCGELMTSYSWLLQNHGKSLKNQSRSRQLRGSTPGMTSTRAGIHAELARSLGVVMPFAIRWISTLFIPVLRNVWFAED